jgi:hypothetical protein
MPYALELVTCKSGDASVLVGVGRRRLTRTLMGMVMVVVPEEAMAILEQVPDYHYIQQEDYENR